MYSYGSSSFGHFGQYDCCYCFGSNTTESIDIAHIYIVLRPKCGPLGKGISGLVTEVVTIGKYSNYSDIFKIFS